ncbi:heterokaryon incompatibility protein-domain-containing protein [Lophiotrema nucula]|uniref:Heterokaryon incompatibility protein-domain-containing protein n=1 Tax=Lophiotrema nucula TaxID=690887 RepID=A0A6A5YNF6_9PLEO|nr:heterokaryon incompatibility protein-domain-containing protein [Lophiotrema nucula]
MTTTNTDNVSDLYACLPLPRESKFIRVLDVYGPSRLDDSDSSIQCDLRVINLNSENYPSFAALSYVWGIEAAEGHFITCGGCTLRVTPNCHSALRYLKEKLGNFTIWIDAICINQKDEGEKMNQILLMGEIYSKAETMYVWLGEGNTATNRAMAYLKTAGYLRWFFRHGKTFEEELRQPRHWTAVWFAFIACFNLPVGLSRSSNHGLNQALPYVGRLDSGEPSGIVYTSYQDMNDLLDREWVRRIWTYQEILLASNPIVVCGGFHLPWARFSLGVTFLEYSGINYQEGNPIIATLNTWAQIVSSRDHLVSSDATYFANIQSCRRKDMPQTSLQRYRKFIVGVSQRTIWLRWLNTLFMFFGLSVTFVVVTIWIVLRKGYGTPAIRSTIPSRVVNAATKASSSAAACVVACVASDIAACAKACDAASSAANSVASLSADLANRVTYQTIDRALGPPFGISFLAFFVSFIIFLGSAWRKYPGPDHVSLAQSEGIDLVDGLCNRKSKEKKDKAIAVQAVLQRLSKTALSPIDNTQSLEYIYKQLCINLMEVTGSLQFLLPASLNRFHEHPSWVPNWSADFDSFWLKSTLFRDKPATATPGSKAYWKLDPRKDNILIVRGRQISKGIFIGKTFEEHNNASTSFKRKTELYLRF